MSSFSQWVKDGEEPIRFVKNARFKNVRIIDPSQDIDGVGTLEVRHGYVDKIVMSNSVIGGDANMDDVADQRDDWELDLDLGGKILCPSFIDIGCAMPEPGFEQKGTFETELSAAAAAGYSHVATKPDTSPVADSPAVISLMLERSEAFHGLRILPFGALTQGLRGEQISELHALKLAGCIGVSNARSEISNQKVLMNCLEYASTHDLLVCFYSESKDLASGGCVHQGETAARLGLPGIPRCAETVALARDLLLVAHTGVKAHFSQVSSISAVELISAAQERGLNVTADVGAPYLYYNDEEIAGFNAHFHLRPPLRTEEDRKGLIAGVKSGVLCAISAAHQPHERAAKMAPFADTEPGMSTYATLLHWASRLVNEDALSWSDWVRGMTAGAKVLDLDAGHLRVGSPAAFNVIDPHLSWCCDEQSMISRGKNNPLIGDTLTAKVMFQVRGFK